MSKASDIVVTNDFSCLIYGKQGTGKTIFGAGAVVRGDVLFVDADSGMLSVKQTRFLTDQQKEHIWFETIRETYYDKSSTQRCKPTAYSRISEIFAQLSKDGTWTDPDSKEVISPKTVVLDTLTSFAEYALDDALWEAGAIETLKITQPQWGSQLRKIGKIIQQGKAFPDINFICLAHEQFKEDNLSGRTWCIPLVTGKFAFRVGSFFDEYYYADVKSAISGEKYILMTRPTGLITARTRLDLPREMETSFKVVLDCIKDRK
uniref:Putative ATPase domain containing protein n=1 Tax=viral metagenome TaxID=1070528 RepID=A0A6M3J2W2_9ZZZZ